MSIDRNSFLETFAQSTPSLNLIFLNHLGAPVKLLSDIPTIEILADKKALTAFIEYAKSHPLVKGMLLTPQYRKTTILVELLDGSELSFCLISNIVRKTLLCLDVHALRKSTHVNEFGMLVPANEYHFEYMTLKSQFGKDPLPERYKSYFAIFETNSRAIIFKHIQTRYNLVFNTLEDLYTPKPNMLLNIIIGLRAEPENSLFRMLLRSFELAAFNLFGWITKKEIRIPVSPVYAPELHSGQKKRSSGQSVL